MLLSHLIEDEHDPLLVELIARRLLAEEPVLIDISTNTLGTIHWPHKGTIESIAVLKMKSVQMRDLAHGEYGVHITYAKREHTYGYKGITNLILPVADFDDLYTLRPTKIHGIPIFILESV